MNNVLFVFLSLSVSGSILALILLALRPLIKNRLSQTWQYYIWLIVVLRFLLPFTPQVSVVGELSRYVQNISNSPAVVEADPGIDLNEEYTIPQAPDIPQMSHAPAPQITETETPAQPAYWRDIVSNIWLLWIGVALVLFVHKAASYRSFVRFIKVGIQNITDVHILDIYRAELSAAKIKRQLPLYENNQVVSPMLVGIIRPVLVIPALEASDDELRNILRHELTHYKRLDFLYKWIVQITLCLHWFNPLVYLINKQINKYCELSCDEAVIKHLDEDGRITYGDALIASLKAQGNYSDFVVSMTMGEKGTIVKERLDAIMSYRKKSRLVICMSVLLTVLLLCGFTFAGAYAAGNTQVEPDISVFSNSSPENIEQYTASVSNESIDYSSVSVTGQGPIGIELVRSNTPIVSFDLLGVENEQAMSTSANVVNDMLEISVINSAQDGINVDFGPNYKNVVRIYIPDAHYTQFEIIISEYVVVMEDFNASVQVSGNRGGFTLRDTIISRGTYNVDISSGPLKIVADRITTDITARVNGGPIALRFNESPTNLYLDTTQCGPIVNRPDTWTSIYSVGNGTPRIILNNTNGPTTIEVDNANTTLILPTLEQKTQWEIDKNTTYDIKDGKVTVPFSVESITSGYVCLGQIPNINNAKRIIYTADADSGTGLFVAMSIDDKSVTNQNGWHNYHGTNGNKNSDTPNLINGKWESSEGGIGKDTSYMGNYFLYVGTTETSLTNITGTITVEY